MKRKLDLLMALAFVPAALGALTACGENTNTVEGVAPPYSGQHGETGGGDEFAPPENDVVKLDGILDEEVYGNVAWQQWSVSAEDVAGKKEETQTMIGTDVRATVVYGQEGFYTSFEVKGNSVFVDLEHSRYRFYDTGISPYIGFLGTSHNYELYLTADGQVGVSTYVGGEVGFGEFELPGVVSSATVYDASGKPCAVNTEETNAYIVEAYFPWRAFGFGEAQAAVMMDVAAIMNFETTSNARAGWISMGEVYGTGWRWSTPDTYWFWGNGGFESSALELELKDYDVDGGSVAFASQTYQALDDVAIDIAPKDGYIIRSVKVNGVERSEEIEYGVLTLKKYGETLRLVVEVTFAPLPADRLTVTGTLMGVAGASDVWPLPQGTTAVFMGLGRFETTVGADGAYTVDLPAGRYQVSVNGFGRETVEIQEAGRTDITLRWDLIAETDNYEVSADESSATVLRKWQRADLNFVGDKFVLFYTVRIPTGATFENGENMGLYFYYGTGEKEYYSTWYLNANNIYVAQLMDAADHDARIGAQLNASLVGIITEEYFAQHGQKVMVTVDDGTLVYYLCDMDGRYHKVSEVTREGGFLKGELMNWKENAFYDEIAYYNGLDALNIRINVNDPADGEVTPESPVYTLGQTVVLNIRPAQEYELKSLLVNGAERVSDVKENKLVLENYMGLTLDVKVRFLKPVEVEVNGPVMAVAGLSKPWNVPDALTQMKFLRTTGEEVIATVTNGNYTAHLKTGAYTVTAAGCLPVTVTIDAGGTKKIVLKWDLIAETAVYTVNEDESSADANAAGSVVDVNLTGGDFVFFFTLKAKLTALETYQALGGRDGAYTYRSVQFVSNDGVQANNIFVSYYRYYSNATTTSRYAKMSKNTVGGAAVPGAQQSLLGANFKITDDDFLQHGMRTMCVLKGSTFSFYMMPTSGANAEKWVLVGKVEGVSGFSKAVFTGAVTGNRRYSDIAFYRGTEEFDALNLE